MFTTTLASAGARQAGTPSDAFLADFAAMYQRQGNYAGSARGEEALAGRQHALSSIHPDTMASTADLALAISRRRLSGSERRARDVEFSTESAG
jgi:hypothetical protein